MLAIVNNENITKKQVEMMKLVFTQKEDGSIVTDTDIINEIIFTKLAYADAVQRGISIDEKELDQIIIETKKAINSDPTNAETLEVYIDQLGLTEDQYWSKARDEYHKLYTLGKYRDNYIMPLFKKEKGSVALDMNNPETNKEFIKYYRNYVQKLMDESRIVYK